MAKYNEETTAQTIVKYLTPESVTASFGLGNNPTIEAQEVQVTEVDGARVGIEGTRSLFKEITPGNGATTFDAINENTGQVITTLTYAQLRHALYGFYVHMATEADT